MENGSMGITRGPLMGEASDGKKAGTMEGRIERLADSVQQAQKRAEAAEREAARLRDCISELETVLKQQVQRIGHLEKKSFGSTSEPQIDAHTGGVEDKEPRRKAAKTAKRITQTQASKSELSESNHSQQHQKQQQQSLAPPVDSPQPLTEQLAIRAIERARSARAVAGGMEMILDVFREREIARDRTEEALIRGSVAVEAVAEGLALAYERGLTVSTSSMGAHLAEELTERLVKRMDKDWRSRFFKALSRRAQRFATDSSNAPGRTELMRRTMSLLGKACAQRGSKSVGRAVALDIMRLRSDKAVERGLRGLGALKESWPHALEGLGDSYAGKAVMAAMGESESRLEDVIHLSAARLLRGSGESDQERENEIALLRLGPGRYVREVLATAVAEEEPDPVSGGAAKALLVISEKALSMSHGNDAIHSTLEGLVSRLSASDGRKVPRSELKHLLSNHEGQ